MRHTFQDPSKSRDTAQRRRLVGALPAVVLVVILALQALGPTGAASAASATAQQNDVADRSQLEEQFGDRETLSIIGKDTRTRITKSASTRNPARGTVFILVRSGGKVISCTGFLVATNRVATAGHCLVDKGRKVPAGDIMVQAGRNGSYRPYKACGASRTWVHGNYLRYTAPGYDYGVVVLKCRYLSRQVLRTEASTYVGGQLRNTTSQIIGYPSDKAFATAWKSVGRITEFPGAALRLFYSNDTAKGMSGAPIYEFDASRPCGAAYCVVGIHTNGAIGSYPYNAGVRLTPQVIRNLRTR